MTTAIKLSELVKDKTPKITRIAPTSGDNFDFASILGPDLLVKAKGPTKPTRKLLDGKELIVLYFTASWVKESKTMIDPPLIDFYNAAVKAKLGVEIVLVSSDGISTIQTTGEVGDDCIRHQLPLCGSRAKSTQDP